MLLPIFLLFTYAAAIDPAFQRPNGKNPVWFGSSLEDFLAANERSRAEFIINGKDAEKDVFPFMVALFYQKRFVCSASLVSPRHVMTAAHCVNLNEYGNDTEPASKFQAVIGSVSRNAEVVKFEKVTAHEDYGDENSHDIALLTLKEPVTMSESVQPICLPKQGRVFENMEATALGWGQISRTKRKSSEILKHVNVDVPPLAYCQLIYGQMDIDVTKNQHVCAGGGISGACFGDSGSPLIVKEGPSKYIAIGVTSFGSRFGCGFPLIPAVYTTTAANLKWLKAQAQPEDICSV